MLVSAANRINGWPMPTPDRFVGHGPSKDAVHCLPMRPCTQTGAYHTIDAVPMPHVGMSWGV